MDKNSFRKYCLKRLKRYSKRSCYGLDKLVSNRVEKVIKLHKPQSILLYIPMKVEVDLRSILKKYRKKIDIFVPFIVGESFKMVQYRLPLRRNGYMIFEPPNSNRVYRNVDMIIVPIVGIDGSYRRVGFGKGMYDRFYEKLQKRAVIIFVQRIKCNTKNIVTDDYDIPADYYITPKELIKVGKYNGYRDIDSKFRSSSRSFNSIYKS